MTSTTLITFLFCTSPHVRSVKLLGSWDNFSKPYVMERDKRVGPGHWRGCHTFTNIICDGAPSQTMSSRSGGLKMGGTYWYYYLLDDDVESHNNAEPVTTHCPFLPGQPVNVLHVPIILPDTLPTHTRERSPSTQRLEQTMNPEDKYMNPREPPKPKLRLRTSPPLLQQPWTFGAPPPGIATNRSASQPSNTAPKITYHRTQEIPTRSVSPPRSRRLLDAFRQWNSSSPSLFPAGDQEKRIANPVVNYPSLTVHQPVQEDRLHIRSHSDEGFCRSPRKDIPGKQGVPGYLPSRPKSVGPHDSTSLSIQERRAQNSALSGLPTPRNPLAIRTKPETFVPTGGSDQITHWRTIKKAISSPSSPTMLAGSRKAPLTPEEAVTPTPFTFMNKRLPTLPNSPSSVMEEALRDLESREKELDTEALASHFSDFTETESVVSESPCERSHFSQWSTDSELISPESMTSSSTFNENQESPAPMSTEFLGQSTLSGSGEASNPDTPHLTEDSKPSPATLVGDSPRFDIPLPRLTISLSPSDLNIPGLCIEDDEAEIESNSKRHAAFFGGIETLESLGFSRSPDAASLHFSEDVKAEPVLSSRYDRAHLSTASFTGQSTMQEMMDELSYLCNIIRSESRPDL